MGKVRAILCAILGAAFLAVATAAPADVSESDVKAAFLPRFARYVTWPGPAAPNGSDPYILCVIGDGSFGSALDTAARSQSVDGHRITVRRLDSAYGAGACQIAYIAGSKSHSVGELLNALRGKPILTVTDSHNGGQRGIIHFAVVDGRVRFSIDEADASSRGLTISSRLLALAISVRQR
ncbi:MAG TPA: YfiR family protein [Sphingomicrobium sp.]|jgi:hypothetical protein|nr:YfiR family protein [Sphingomicrobium sp.]